MKHRSLKKRIAALLLALIIIIPGTAAAQAKYFTDVAIGHWARDSINYVADNNFISGTSNTIFSPSSTLTRALTATMIYRLAGSPSITTTSQFTDVSSSSTYAKAISWVYSKGIMNGTTATTFEPSTGIRRQDIAVVLYRYANLKGYSTSETTSLSAFTDTDDIYAYAMPAMKWAVAKGIITGQTTTTLAPMMIVVRQTGAELLKRFCSLVEGIVWGRDNYSFANSADNFYSETYGKKYIKSSDLETMRYYASLAGETSYYTNSALVYMNEPWGGSCFGLSATAILDKIGKLDINGNYGSSSNTTLFSLGKPKNNLSLESAINYYQILAVMPSTTFAWYTANYTRIKSIIQKIDEVGLVHFSYTFKKSSGGNSGHSIVLYDYVKNSNGSYTVYAYDNRYPNKITTLTINSEFTSCIVHNEVGVDEKVIELCLITNFDRFDLYDIDMHYNDFGAGASATSTGNQILSNEATINNSNNTYLTVRLNGDFTITNAEGETLIYQNGNFSGTMDIISKQPIIESPDVPLEYRIEVNNSDSFTYTSDNDTSELSVLNDQIFSKGSGHNLDSIKIDSLGDVYIEGSSMEYTMLKSVDKEDICMIALNGHGSGKVSVSDMGTGIQYNGIIGNCSIITYNPNLFEIDEITNENTFTATGNKVLVDKIGSGENTGIGIFQQSKSGILKITDIITN